MLRAGNRHHADASGRHARLRPVPPRRRRSRAVARAASTSSTTARRSCTSAPSRCASTSRRSFPHIYLYTSTNGLALTEAQARRLVHSGIDEVTFSIDGATQESYVKYRQRGRFDLAIANLRAMADEKRRAGRDVPFLNWRYILFTWNDSDEEMERARQLARRHRRRPPVLGDDRSSRRTRTRAGSCPARRPRRDPARDLGRQQPRQRDSRRHAARAIDVRTLVPGVPAGRGARRTAAAGPDARPQPVDAAVSGAGDATAAGSCASARSSATRTARSSIATSRARGCRRRSGRATALDVPIEIPGARAARTLHAEVRSGQRRDRLVRALRLGDDDATLLSVRRGRDPAGGRSPLDGGTPSRWTSCEPRSR